MDAAAGETPATGGDRHAVSTWPLRRWLLSAILWLGLLLCAMVLLRYGRDFAGVVASSASGSATRSFTACNLSDSGTVFSRSGPVKSRPRQAMHANTGGLRGECKDGTRERSCSDGRRRERRARLPVLVI